MSIDWPGSTLIVHQQWRFRAVLRVLCLRLEAARRAWRRFGKGNHPVALNFRDCFVYALADVTGEPLLFKDEDFARTDVEAA